MAVIENQENFDLFSMRYPQLAFLTNILASRKKPAQDYLLKSALRQIPYAQIIYLYGLGKGDCLHLFSDWLNQNTERSLVVIEDELAALAAFVESDRVIWLKNPRFHIRFLLEKESFEDFCNECAREFPVNRITFYHNKSSAKKKVFEKIKLWMLRKTTLQEALLSEKIHYYRLYKNLHENFKTWSSSFLANSFKGAFKNCPAVICGAGPSLEDHVDDLSLLRNKALIIAGGTAISALSNLGVEPHLNMAIDPNPKEYDCLKPASAFETPLLYGNRLNSDILQLFNGPRGYLQTMTGGAAEYWMENALGLPNEFLDHGNHEEALSITTTAISYAALLGCNPIYLCGVDLAFVSSKKYAKGAEEITMDLELCKQDMRASETLIAQKTPFGKQVFTQTKWIMEATWISAFARQHPEISFFSASKKGLGFESVHYQSLKQLKNFTERDFRGKISALIASNPFPASLKEIQKSLNILQKSLERCKTICEQILKELRQEKRAESVAFSLYKMQLEEEEAFKALLDQTEEALLTHYSTINRMPPEASPKEKNIYDAVISEKVWSKMLAMITDFLETFEKNALPR